MVIAGDSSERTSSLAKVQYVQDVRVIELRLKREPDEGHALEFVLGFVHE